MLPDIWGRDMWNSIHRIAYNYPDNPTNEDRENYRNYYHDLQYVLPCNKCRMNYQQHLIEIPLTDQVLSSKMNLIDWTIKIHNLVNQSLGKTILTNEEAMKKINELVQPKKTNNWIIYLAIIILIVIILIIIIIYYNKLCINNN